MLDDVLAGNPTRKDVTKRKQRPPSFQEPLRSSRPRTSRTPASAAPYIRYIYIYIHTHTYIYINITYRERDTHIICIDISMCLQQQLLRPLLRQRADVEVRRI